MTFDEILAQVIALLQRQGRMSYRALKIRFNLDDEYLDVLKEELIDAQRVATDEDGRILVWTGEVEGTTDTASPPDTTSQRPPQIAPPPTAPHTPDAERRQLTVMFCDLVSRTCKVRGRTGDQVNRVEFIPIKPLAATGSDGLGSYAGHSRVPSRDRGHRSSIDGSGLSRRGSA
jgi:hypothetical protein